MNVSIKINEDMLDILAGYYRMFRHQGQEPKNMTDFIERIITRGAVPLRHGARRSRADASLLAVLGHTESEAAKMWEGILSTTSENGGKKL